MPIGCPIQHEMCVFWRRKKAEDTHNTRCAAIAIRINWRQEAIREPALCFAWLIDLDRVSHQHRFATHLGLNGLQRLPIVPGPVWRESARFAIFSVDFEFFWSVRRPFGIWRFRQERILTRDDLTCRTHGGRENDEAAPPLQAGERLSLRRFDFGIDQ